MTERSPVPKKARFEVFKRDSFTCQYCGAKAPDVVLHVDHIHPVAEGGGNDPLNLVTACLSCNLGKAATRLDDRSTVERQRAQIEELQARREQLEMMLDWRQGLDTLQADTIKAIVDRVAQRGGFAPNESGLGHIRRWLRSYSLTEILMAVDRSFDIYMRFNKDDPIAAAWELAFKRIPGVCNIQRQELTSPWLGRALYIQGILRNRFDTPRVNYVSALGEIIEQERIHPDVLESLAKVASDWDEFQALVIAHAEEREEPANGADS